MLRQDNADIRLTPLGYEIGLVPRETYEEFCRKQELIAQEIERVKHVNVPPSEELARYFESVGTEKITTGCKLSQLIKRPQLSYEGLAPFDKDRKELPDAVKEQVELQIKYEGYIAIQQEQVEAMRKLEAKKLPADIDYTQIKGLRLEAIEKLAKIMPLSVGQASRISGVNPADVGVLLVWLEQNRRKAGEKDA